MKMPDTDSMTTFFGASLIAGTIYNNIPFALAMGAFVACWLHCEVRNKKDEESQKIDKEGEPDEW